MKKPVFIVGLLAALAIPAFAVAMTDDTPVTINGVQFVCTGVGSSEDNPQWQSYPVRIEFSNGAQQFVAGEHVVLKRGVEDVAAIDCDAPWVLLKPPAGNYSALATLPGEPDAKPRSVSFTTSGHGPQKRVEVQFAHLPANQ